MYRSFLLVFLTLSLSLVHRASAQLKVDSVKAKQIVDHLYKDEYASGFQLLEGVEEQYEYGPPSKSYVKLLIDVGGVFAEKGNYETSQKFLFKALLLADQQSFESLQAEILLEIGYVYYFLEQIDKGIEYGNKALRIAADLNELPIQATAFNLLGILNLKNKNIDIALENLNKALTIRKQLNNARGIASTLSNIALVLEEKKEYEQALVLQKRSIEMDDSLKNSYGVAWSKQMIGDLLLRMKRFQEAHEYLSQAESMGHELDAKEVLLQTYKSKLLLFEAEQKYKEAFYYSNAYNALRDSVYNSGLAGKVSILQQSFELRDKDKKILLQQASLNSQRKFFWFVGFASLIISTMLFFYYRAYRRTRILNTEIAEQNEEIQAQSEELTEANETLRVLNIELAEQREEIQAQAEELIESNSTIYRLNDHLSEEVEKKSKELVKTNDELVKHNNELLQFSYTVSHNLRGPVARLLGLMNLISITKIDEEKEVLIKHLQQSTIDLDVVLKDLNLIIDTRNKLYKVRERIFFEDEWVKTLSLLREYITPAITIRTHFEKADHLFSIRAIIQSIFYNLLSNAIKYASPERHLVVDFSTHIETESVVLTFSDNGLGIDLENQRLNIFKLYKRFHSHVSGKGLGLYLVKTQVEALGGFVSVESQLNVGTTFTVTLPIPPDLDKQILLENEAALLYYDANINNTIISWKRHITSKEYREVFETVVKTLPVYNSPSWIADMRKQGVIAAEDRQWFLNHILPEAAKCGLVRIATIGLKDLSRKAYYEDIQLKVAELGIELKVVDSLEEAKQWMSSLHVEKRSLV